MSTSQIVNSPTSGRPSPPESVSLSEEVRVSSNALLQVSMQARRTQVLAACKRCRKRKSKCDGHRPCATCAKRDLDCQYETKGGETYSQASKRKYDELVRSYDVYVKVFAMIRDQSQREASEVMRWIRSGRSPEDIVAFIESNHAASVFSDPAQLARDAFLINLAHSTGSLRDIIDLAASTLGKYSTIRLPTTQELQRLRNRIIHVSHLQSLSQPSRPRIEYPRRAASTGDQSTSSSLHTDARPVSEENIHGAQTHNSRNDEDGTPHNVPAAPWTSITTSDEAVSHLISLFLAWINPTWRFVEQDLFLQGMRSKSLQSSFCSPFLVNAACAIASLHSEHEVTFVPPDQDRITRGQRFHDEALRLWKLEEGRPTLTNIQALCVLGLDSNYRAKDKLGLQLVPIAVKLDSWIPANIDKWLCADQGVSTQDYARLRLATHWTARCAHVIMRIAFLSENKVESRITGVPKIHDVFEDRVEAWTGYPLSEDVVHYRPTLYLRERCRLAELFQKTYDLIIASDWKRNATISMFAREVNSLVASIRQWYHHLPFELHYVWPMSVAIWELQSVNQIRCVHASKQTDVARSASYTAALMIFLLAARTHFLHLENSTSPISDDRDPDLASRLASEKLSEAILLAHTATNLLRDFRKRYGLKITPAWLLQLQAVAASVLILDPVLLHPPAVSHSPFARDHDNQLIEDSHTAFDEVFRCLLGTAVEVMIARGIARMVYHTALEQKIALSQSTRSMLQIMSDTAWRPRDLSMVNSNFPNFSTQELHDSSKRLTDLLIQWEDFNV